MIKRKLKEWVIPTLGIIVLIGAILCYYIVSNIVSHDLTLEDFYVTNIMNSTDTIDVNSEIEVSSTLPYKGEDVSISKYYYSKDDTEERQQNSLIKYENIYMPNTGILYSSDNSFEVIAVLDGKVTSIKEDNILGNIIEIEHDNNYYTIYESVSEVKVKVGDTVKSGDTIALSGQNKLENEKENCLHFEVYQDGTLLNPENFLNNEKK